MLPTPANLRRFSKPRAPLGTPDIARASGRAQPDDRLTWRSRATRAPLDPRSPLVSAIDACSTRTSARSGPPIGQGGGLRPNPVQARGTPAPLNPVQARGTPARRHEAPLPGYRAWHPGVGGRLRWRAPAFGNVTRSDAAALRGCSRMSLGERYVQLTQTISTGSEIPLSSTMRGFVKVTRAASAVSRLARISFASATAPTRAAM